MNAPLTTPEKLRHHARRLIWAKGYSNVSLRQIAAAADVDVALIARHFGGKMGVFEATLEGAFADPTEGASTAAEVTAQMLHLFVHAPRGGDTPSIVQMILTNAQDADVGQMVRTLTHQHFYDPLCRLFGNAEKTALFISVLMGISVVEKTLKLPDYPAPQTTAYADLLSYMMQAALTYEGPPT